MTPEVLSRLHHAAFTLPPAWSADVFAAFLKDPACLVLSRQDNTELLGFALIRVVADEAELLTLATAPHARRRGLARNLLREGLEQAQARGAVRCFLEVAADNLAAIALYHGAGFRQVGVRTNYYRAKGQAPVDALVFQAILS